MHQTGDKIHISDPCYEYDEQDTTCVLTLKEVSNGKYFAKINVIERYNDVESLTICHEKYLEVEPDFLTGTIGVDSGQAGIFDLKYYAENQGGEFGDLNSFLRLGLQFDTFKTKRRNYE